MAPHGGCERRLSANPLGGAAPRPNGPPMMMDISTSTIAEGKIKVARSRGDSLPAGLFVNSSGEASTSPEEYYASPPGALLPMAGHKGFALSMMCEVFAGAMTGAGCSKDGVERVANGFMAFLLDPAAFAGQEFVSSELGNLAEWVKSSRLQEGFDTIQLPGEPEAPQENNAVSQGSKLTTGRGRKSVRSQPQSMWRSRQSMLSGKVLHNPCSLYLMVCPKDGCRNAAQCERRLCVLPQRGIMRKPGASPREKDEGKRKAPTGRNEHTTSDRPVGALAMFGR